MAAVLETEARNARPDKVTAVSGPVMAPRKFRRPIIESDDDDDNDNDVDDGGGGKTKQEKQAAAGALMCAATMVAAAAAVAPTTTYSMDTDISQLQAPTFTTLDRGPSKAMLRLKWDHKVNLMGKKVVNPMIHCCDQCLKPILIYGRMIPCKHVFCLGCATAQATKCGRCGDKVNRVEPVGLGYIFMCSHGGSRYGNNGCRRTYLSQRDLQAHIQHRHVRGVGAVVATTATACTLSPAAVAMASSSTTSCSSASMLASPAPSCASPASVMSERKVRPQLKLEDRQSSGCSGGSGVNYPDSSHSPATEVFRTRSYTQPPPVITSSRQSNLITVPIQDSNGLSSAAAYSNLPNMSQPPPTSGLYFPHPHPPPPPPHAYRGPVDHQTGNQYNNSQWRASTHPHYRR